MNCTIGHDWLKLHNPSIDWEKGTLAFTWCNYTPKLVDPEEDDDDLVAQMEYHPEEGDRLLMVDMAEPIRLRATSNIAQKLAEAASKTEKKK
jgi:hypothetical protein